MSKEFRKFKITSDGTSAGTFVFSPDGKKVEGVSSIKIDKIKPDSIVTATITIITQVEFDLLTNVG